jgi:3-hydroxybutyryl-CoA dehydrogenase
VSIQLAGVVGAGTMGAGIAELFARAGLRTTVVETDPGARSSLRRRVRASLERAEAIGRLESPVTEIAGRIVLSDSLHALSDHDLVVEAIDEDVVAKANLFRTLGMICRPDAILASNSSAIPVAKLARTTAGPGRVVGLHFFNPAPVQPLVEVVSGSSTDRAVIDRLVPFCELTLGKHVVVTDDRPGFVVSALLVPYLLSAIRMLESGFATAREIDDSMRYACAHPLGPLALADLMGLDTLQSVAGILHAEHGGAEYAVPALLDSMVRAGLLGRKTGAGFFPYDTP